jgi:hypothetical protein
VVGEADREAALRAEVDAALDAIGA